MNCEEIRAALSASDYCENTEGGARITTHCLYPSFEPVSVFVGKLGDGFIVSDGGGALNAAWEHGRDEVRRIAAKCAARYGVTYSDGVLRAEIPNAEWLRSAILGVANASAAAAHAAIDRAAQAAEQALTDRIFEALVRVVSPKSVHRDYEYAGISGKHWKADFAVPSNGELLIVNAVTPHPISISAKYVAFADVNPSGPKPLKFAVHARPLNSEDTSLITQVASLVPVNSLELGARRVLLHAGSTVLN